MTVLFEEIQYMLYVFVNALTWGKKNQKKKEKLDYMLEKCKLCV